MIPENFSKNSKFFKIRSKNPRFFSQYLVSLFSPVVLARVDVQPRPKRPRANAVETTSPADPAAIKTTPVTNQDAKKIDELPSETRCWAYSRNKRTQCSTAAVCSSLLQNGPTDITSVHTDLCQTHLELAQDEEAVNSGRFQWATNPTYYWPIPADAKILSEKPKFPQKPVLPNPKIDTSNTDIAPKIPNPKLGTITSADAPKISSPKLDTTPTVDAPEIKNDILNTDAIPKSSKSKPPPGMMHLAPLSLSPTPAPTPSPSVSLSPKRPTKPKIDSPPAKKPLSELQKKIASSLQPAAKRIQLTPASYRPSTTPRAKLTPAPSDRSYAAFIERNIGTKPSLIAKMSQSRSSPKSASPPAAVKRPTKAISPPIAKSKPDAAKSTTASPPKPKTAAAQAKSKASPPKKAAAKPKPKADSSKIAAAKSKRASPSKTKTPPAKSKTPAAKSKTKSGDKIAKDTTTGKKIAKDTAAGKKIAKDSATSSAKKRRLEKFFK